METIEAANTLEGINTQAIIVALVAEGETQPRVNVTFQKDHPQFELILDTIVGEARSKRAAATAQLSKSGYLKAVNDNVIDLTPEEITG